MHDVPDASDWVKTSIPQFKNFESILQCPICSEYLSNAPTITECGHTFCFECITRHLRTDSKCPLCMTQISSNLRTNKIIEDLLDVYMRLNLRSKLLNMASIPEPATEPTKRKRNETELVEVDKFSSPPPNDQNSPSDIPTPASELAPGMAQCPICNDIFEVDFIQRYHVDKCTGKSNQHKRRRTSPFLQQCPTVKLPIPTFKTLTDKKLKAKLSDANLSTKGTRKQLIDRYSEWVTIWNSAFNSKFPKSIKELEEDIKKWDKKQEYTRDNLKDLDSTNWKTQNKDNYDALIEQARNSASKKRK